MVLMQLKMLMKLLKKTAKSQLKDLKLNVELIQDLKKAAIGTEANSRVTHCTPKRKKSQNMRGYLEKFLTYYKSNQI